MTLPIVVLVAVGACASLGGGSSGSMGGRPGNGSMGGPGGGEAPTPAYSGQGFWAVEYTSTGTFEIGTIDGNTATVPSATYSSVALAVYDSGGPKWRTYTTNDQGENTYLNGAIAADGKVFLSLAFFADPSSATTHTVVDPKGISDVTVAMSAGASSIVHVVAFDADDGAILWDQQACTSTATGVAEGCAYVEPITTRRFPGITYSESLEAVIPNGSGRSQASATYTLGGTYAQATLANANQWTAWSVALSASSGSFVSDSGYLIARPGVTDYIARSQHPTRVIGTAYPLIEMSRLAGSATMTCGIGRSDAITKAIVTGITGASCTAYNGSPLYIATRGNRGSDNTTRADFTWIGSNSSGTSIWNHYAAGSGTSSTFYFETSPANSYAVSTTTDDDSIVIAYDNLGAPAWQRKNNNPFRGGFSTSFGVPYADGSRVGVFEFSVGVAATYNANDGESDEASWTYAADEVYLITRDFAGGVDSARKFADWDANDILSPEVYSWHETQGYYLVTFKVAGTGEAKTVATYSAPGSAVVGSSARDEIHAVTVKASDLSVLEGVKIADSIDTAGVTITQEAYGALLAAGE